MSKRQKKRVAETVPAYEKGRTLLASSPLGSLAQHVYIYSSPNHPMAKGDWAYVTSRGLIWLNPHRSGTDREWAYILAHCMLHLGLGHMQRERLEDPLWQRACDLVVTRFLRECKIGQAPLEFLADLELPARNEKQTLEQLRQLPPERRGAPFCTMTGGRPGMIWDQAPRQDFEKLLADSLMDAMRESIRRASGLPAMGEADRHKSVCEQAREWFVTSYPLLGALASSFRLVTDQDTLRRLDVPFAAVSPQLGEIYANPMAKLSFEEWKFVMAHEFLHAALRHDARCEDREPVLWNVACDFVINLWLREMSVGVMPDFVLYDEQFKGMTAEAVYMHICQDARYYMKLGQADLLYGDDAWWERLDGMDLDAYYRSALQQGLAFHQETQRGYLPADLVEEIYALSMPPIHWDVALAQWFDTHFEPLNRTHSYARMSRRQAATPDIPRPAWHIQEAEVAERIYGVLLDTSGSMERHMLAAALGSIASYSQARDVHHVRVVFCDAAAYDQGVMDPADLVEAVQVRGRGGTVLQPGIDLLDADTSFPKDAPLLIITDGECDHLQLHGREHAYLIPWGRRLPFTPKGPVFRLKL